MKKFIKLFLVLGLIIPIILSGIWNYYETILYDTLLGNVLFKLQLLLWPSSIFMMATAGYKGIAWGMLLISIAVNLILYTVIGFLIWWGINKQHWVLYVVIALILLGWYKILYFWF